MDDYTLAFQSPILIITGSDHDARLVRHYCIVDRDESLRLDRQYRSFAHSRQTR